MKKPSYYVTDPWHFLDENGELPDDLPGPARRLTIFLAPIISEMRGLPAERAFLTSLKYQQRPVRRPHLGKILSWRNNENDSINWECSHCGAGGEIHNWKRSPWDGSAAGEAWVS
jgi:hypothetical protein